VIVLDSADPEFFLAHWDIADPALTDALGRSVAERGSSRLDANIDEHPVGLPEIRPSR